MKMFNFDRRLKQSLFASAAVVGAQTRAFSRLAIFRPFLFIAAYFFIERLTFLYGFYNEVAVIWLPFGMAVAALLLFGFQFWPVVLIANLFAFFPFSHRWDQIIGTTVAETLATICCFSILNSMQVNLGFDRLRDLWALVMAAMVASVVSLLGGILFWDVYVPDVRLIVSSKGFTWWLSHVLACVIVLPLLSWTQPQQKLFFKNRLPEFYLALSLTLLTAYLGFNHSLGVALFVLPTLCWSALRFGQAGASVAVLLISTLAASTSSSNNQLVLQLEKHGFQMIPIWVQLSVCLAGAIGIVLSIIVRTEALRQAAEEANTAKNQFVANFSHEIRTPLGVIAGFVELALPSDLRSVDAREYLLTIQRNAKQALRLVNDILDISKMEAGHLDIQLVPVALSEVLNELQASFAPLADDNNLRLQFEVDSCVPELIITDPERLRQILSNLLTNSIKFTRQGFVKLRVDSRVVGRRGDRRVNLRFLVSDTGMGISSSQQARLFQPFTRNGAGVQDKRFAGSGLGLALSRNLARLMGGELELVSSRENRGSTFALTLPVEYQEFTNVRPLRRRTSNPRV